MQAPDLKTRFFAMGAGFPIRMWAEGLPVFITGTGFAVYLSTNNNT